jgi:WD40 repeat protein
MQPSTLQGILSKLKSTRTILLTVSLAVGGTGLVAGRLAAEDVVRLPHRRTVVGMAFSPDSKTLATGNLDSGLYLWDMATGKELWRSESVEAHGVAFSPDGRTVAAVGWKGIIRIFDVAKGAKLRELFRGKDMYTLAFSPDGKVLAVGGRNNGVSVCDVVSGKVVRQFDGKGRIHAVAFSPDGTLLACGTTGERVSVWDMATGEEARAFRGQEIHGGCVAFSPDGRILAASGSENGIDGMAFREVATGGVLRRLRTGTDRIHALAFSPDGRALVAGGGKSAVKLWGLATGQLLGEFEGHRDPIFAVCFSPDGKSLAAGGSDKAVFIWDVGRRMKKEKVSSPVLTAEELKRLWKDLAGEDAATAYRAVWTLSANPQQAVPFLTEHLRSATAFDKRRVQQLIADLDSDRFVVRQQAETELAKKGWLVESALRRVRKEGASLEVRRRLTNLLQELESANPSGAWLPVARSLAVLEWVGTTEARRVLKMLAEGAPESRLTREAADAVRRLK